MYFTLVLPFLNILHALVCLVSAVFFSPPFLLPSVLLAFCPLSTHTALCVALCQHVLPFVNTLCPLCYILPTHCALCAALCQHTSPFALPSVLSFVNSLYSIRISSVVFYSSHKGQSNLDYHLSTALCLALSLVITL